MTILCARVDEPVEFVKCVSGGWITAAICKEGKSWIFPFGRAMSTIPNIPVGMTEEFNDVTDISVGSSHVVIVTRNKEVWTFGLNDHGQRGFTDLEGIDSWCKLNAPMREGGIITQVACGRWNTFLVIRNKVWNNIVM